MANLLLFVCTGNTCRSPLAEGLTLNWMKNNQIKEWEVKSAGTFAVDGCPTNPKTIGALLGQGIEFAGFSTSLSKELVDRATVVLCMTASHCVEVAEIAEDPNKVELLDQKDGITDPLGGSQSVYDALAARLLEIIPARLAEIVEQTDINEE